MNRSVFTEFRKEIKDKLEEIYNQEGSMIPIEIDNPQIQDIIEMYDENFSKPYIDIAIEEVYNFKNRTIDE